MPCLDFSILFIVAKDLNRSIFRSVISWNVVEFNYFSCFSISNYVSLDQGAIPVSVPIPGSELKFSLYSTL